MKSTRPANPSFRVKQIAGKKAGRVGEVVALYHDGAYSVKFFEPSPYHLYRYVRLLPQHCELIVQEDCPGHVASPDNPKVCARCGIHIDELRPT